MRTGTGLIASAMDSVSGFDTSTPSALVQICDTTPPPEETLPPASEETEASPVNTNGKHVILFRLSPGVCRSFVEAARGVGA